MWAECTSRPLRARAPASCHISMLLVSHGSSEGLAPRPWPRVTQGLPRRCPPHSPLRPAPLRPGPRPGARRRRDARGACPRYLLQRRGRPRAARRRRRRRRRRRAARRGAPAAGEPAAAPGAGRAQPHGQLRGQPRGARAGRRAAREQLQRGARRRAQALEPKARGREPAPVHGARPHGLAPLLWSARAGGRGCGEPAACSGAERRASCEAAAGGAQRPSCCHAHDAAPQGARKVYMLLSRGGTLGRSGLSRGLGTGCRHASAMSEPAPIPRTLP